MTDSDIAVVAVTETEFEARAKAAVLEAEGIKAMVTSNAPSWTGQMPVSPTARGASVLVNREDLDRARSLLTQAVEDSVDLDWDEVDVGEREDDLPLHTVGRMPPLAKIALAVAIAIVILSVLLAVVWLAMPV
jgi:hypothetical protein